MPQFPHTGSGEPQLSFWGSPRHHQAGGRWRSTRSLPTAQVRQALPGKGRKNPYPFLKGFGGLKRRVRARKDRPGLGKPCWWGEIPARAFSTRATFYLNTLPSPGYPYIPLSQSIAPPKADATQSPNCTPVPVSPSAACQNTPTQRGTEPPPPRITPMTPHHPPPPHPGEPPRPGSVPPSPAPSPGDGPAPAGGARSGWVPGGRWPTPPAAGRSGGRVGWPAAVAAGRSTS